jgi:hypothetical protein
MDRSITGSMELESDASVRKAFVGMVRARDVHLEEAAAGFIAAGGDLSILNGGCGRSSPTAGSRSATGDAVP